MNYRIWQAPPSDAAAQTALQAAGYGALFSRVLAARGVKTPQQAHSLLAEQAELSDPYRLKDMDKAVERIRQAIENEESIVIFGDYDVDGVSATAILYECLSNQGAHVRCKLPSRDGGGYGLNAETVRSLAAKGYKLVITVDNGITAVAEADCAAELGLDLVITDHHLPGETLPRAAAVVDPNRADDESPCKSLCGAGVAFKLCAALEDCAPGDLLEMFGELAALGTIADMMPLQGENRTMVKYGIEILRKQFRPGVRALIESSKLRNELTPSDITFKLAPRINAAGRVGDANVAMSLLESDNIVQAYHFAGELENYNRIRQEKEQEIYQEAKAKLEASHQLQEKYALLVAGQGWHQGVIGIVASRLARDYNRPTIVLTIQGDHAYGSGRSVGSLNLVEMLSNTADALERYGGHPMAVGVGLLTSRINEFHEALEKEVRKNITPEDLAEFISYDGETELEYLNSEMFEYMKMLAPFGHGNPKPVFRFNQLDVCKCYLIGQRHTRGVVANSKGVEMEFIAFNQLPEQFIGRRMDVLATPQLNNYYNVERPQLNIISARCV